MSETKLVLEDVINETLDSLEKFGETLGIEKSFFKSLLTKDKDDDWAFLVKTHTLIETALAHLINEELDRKELSTLIEKFSIDGGRVSKLAFIEAMKLLQKPQLAYIRELSTLRNMASHNIQSISISLEDQVSKMSEETLKKLVIFPVKNKKLLDFVKREPRFVIWMSAMLLLELIYNKKEEIIRKRVFSSSFFLSSDTSPTIKGLLG